MAEEDLPIVKKESTTARLLKLALKILVTVLCFWYISTKINFGKAIEAILNASWVLLLVTVLVYVLSKLVAAFRLQIYFNNIQLQLTHLQNIKLYWLGMFYNLFLPGSISGDAYKVFLLNKRLAAPLKKTGAAVLLDRFSGLLGLGILLSIYGIIVLHEKWIGLTIMGGCLLAILAFYLVIREFFPDFLRSFWTTLFQGLLVQTIQAGGLYVILAALRVTHDQSQWIFIFLTASIISVLPISLGGGLGTREVVFAEGAGFFGLDPETGVVISLLFYLSSVAASLPGAYYIFNKPLSTKYR